MKHLIAALTVLLLSIGSVASAQSLAEIAKKERQRRDQLGTGKVSSYDDNDLRSRGARVPASPAETPATEGESGSEAEAEEESEEEDPEKTQVYWRDRISAIDRRIAGLESQLNVPGFAEDPSNLARRTRLERDLQQARSERQAVLDEARRKGVPPGWVR